MILKPGCRILAPFARVALFGFQHLGPEPPFRKRPRKDGPPALAGEESLPIENKRPRGILSRKLGAQNDSFPLFSATSFSRNIRRPNNTGFSR